MKNRGSKAILSCILASGMFLGGCSTIRNWTGMGGGSDPGSAQNSQMSSAEMKDVCDLQRRMANMPRDSQDALLESHMKSAHGGATSESISAHRQMMARC